MVTQAFPRVAGKRGWSLYLLLSAAANAFVIQAAGLGPLPVRPLDLPVLKISLSAVAAPAPVVAQPPPPEPIAARQPVVPPVETVAAAPVSIAPPRPDPAPERIPDPARPPTAAEHPSLPLPARRPARRAPADSAPPIEAEASPESAPAPVVAQPSSPSTSASADAGQQAATVVHEANYRRRTSPVYPARAVEMGQQGTVLLHAEVRPDGRPRNLKVVASSGHRLLDAAALAAVRGWLFEPTQIDGAAVTSWVRVPVRFVIQQ